MAVKIRLKRLGTKKSPHYRIVAIPSFRGRDSKSLEELGTYNPQADPAIFKINKERLNYWLGVGAKPSETIKSLLKKEGVSLKESSRDKHR